jgi:hypothetical protein
MERELKWFLESDDRLSLSIGNLPPKQDVFLKVTYISELVFITFFFFFFFCEAFIHCDLGNA